jgi:hypothetical protein
LNGRELTYINDLNAIRLVKACGIRPRILMAKIQYIAFFARKCETRPSSAHASFRAFLERRLAWEIQCLHAY